MECDYCDKQATRILENGNKLCDSLECFAEEIYNQTVEKGD